MPRPPRATSTVRKQAKTPAKPASPGRRTRVTSGETRRRILTAALDIFAQRSFDGASLQDIARAAKVGQPLIHYHFKSKDLLWQETVDYAFGHLSEQFNDLAVAAVDLSPADTLKLMIRAFIQFSSRSPQHSVLILNEIRGDPERLRWVVKKHLKQKNGFVDKAVLNAVNSGQIKNIPPAYITTFIINACVNFFSAAPLLKSLYGVDAFDTETIDEFAHNFIDILFNGILIKPSAAIPD